MQYLCGGYIDEAKKVFESLLELKKVLSYKSPRSYLRIKSALPISDEAMVVLELALASFIDDNENQVKEAIICGVNNIITEELAEIKRVAELSAELEQLLKNKDEEKNNAKS